MEASISTMKHKDAHILLSSLTPTSHMSLISIRVKSQGRMQIQSVPHIISIPSLLQIPTEVFSRPTALSGSSPTFQKPKLQLFTVNQDTPFLYPKSQMVSSRFSSNVNPYNSHKVLGWLGLPPPLISLYPTGNTGLCNPAIHYILFIYHTCFYLNIFALDSSSAFAFPVCFSRRILQSSGKCANHCIQMQEHTQTHSHRHKHIHIHAYIQHAHSHLHIKR